MKKITILLLLVMFIFSAKAQENKDNKKNEASKLSIGGYAQIDFNGQIGNTFYTPANLDVHRVVTMLGYKFSKQTQFVTELEYEHVSEISVEQAYLRHRINDYINFKAGLMLIPMGIINEFHEPPTYMGVERPNVDTYIVPTTWREIGVGFTGNIKEVSLKYQLYLINGFKSWDNGTAYISGEKGLRKGRQKGFVSFMSSPNVSTKWEFYGIRRLKIGASFVGGKTQSTRYADFKKADVVGKKSADSTVLGMGMFGIDARYSLKGFSLKGQYNLLNLQNTIQYNQAMGTDVGKRLTGFYLEASYNIFETLGFSTKLSSFIRYEKYNTHAAVEGNIIKNDSYNHTDITAGLVYELAKGAVLKADYSQMGTANKNLDTVKMINLGVGVWF